MAVLKCALSLLALLLFGAQAFKVEISHFNDVSGQLERFMRGTSNSSSAPKECNATATNYGNCIGGLVNTVHWLNQPRDNTATKKIIVSSGNIIGGESGWLSSLAGGWKTYGEVVRDYYKPDVMALGMKEFGAGVQQTLDFIQTVGDSAVLANTCEGSIVGTVEKAFCEDPNLAKIKIITAADDSSQEFKIGFIGFATPLVERLSIPGKLKFANVVDSVKKVVASNAGVKLFVAVGDGTLDLAKQILNQVPKVQLVIYSSGLSNTRDMSKDYPMKYRDAYIVTAGRYGSSIGKLVLDIESSTGKIKQATGAIQETVFPKELNEAGQNAITAMNPLRAEVQREINNTVGHTRVTLQGGEKCWREECNLGNLMTDAMVHCALSINNTKMNFPLHALWHGGAFFEDEVKGGAMITKFDIHKWLPYHNKAYLVSITGRNLKQVFDASAGGIDPKKANVKDWRQFLQVSDGLEIYYDYKDVPKVNKIRLTHDIEGVPRLLDLQMNNMYYFVIPTYLYEGRGVYNFTVGKWTNVKVEGLPDNKLGFDDDCLEGYIRALGQVSVGFEERIWINGDPSDRPSGKCPKENTALTVFLTIIFFSIFLAIGYVGYFYLLPRLRRTNEDLSVRYPPNQL